MAVKGWGKCLPAAISVCELANDYALLLKDGFALCSSSSGMRFGKNNCDILKTYLFHSYSRTVI